jgi:hypothetical protein
MILFGAGASRFSGPCYPANPPLGDRLFDDLVKMGGACSKLAPKYQEIFRCSGFEAGMEAVTHLGSKFVLPMLKETAMFLSDFSIREGNHYFLLVAALGKRILSETCFASLNYDLLLEQSLLANGINCEYVRGSHAAPRSVPVLKLHGSSNFLPILPEGLIIEGNFFGGLGNYVVGLPTKVVARYAEIAQWCLSPRNEDMAPVLSVYAKGKPVAVNSGFVEQIQNQWLEHLEEADLIILVGVRYVEHDTHVWDPLAKARAVIAVVNPEFDVANWAKAKRRAPTFHLARGFSEIARIVEAIKTQF